MAEAVQDLTKVERPYQEEIRLCLGGPVLLVDHLMGLRYDERKGIPRLIFAAPAGLSIERDRGGSLYYQPREVADPDKVKLLGLGFTGFNGSQRVYIGNKYQLTLTERWVKPGMTLILTSTKPLDLDYGYTDELGFLVSDYIASQQLK